MRIGEKAVYITLWELEIGKVKLEIGKLNEKNKSGLSTVDYEIINSSNSTVDYHIINSFDP